MFDEYHEVNREVLRIEQNIEPVTDEYAEETKKRRLLLKDQLYAILNTSGK
ncbi:MAG: YdcH family protein [Methylophilaceae bacterium]